MTIATRRLVISGRVQGVGFRFYLQHQARGLGLAGWVRNRRDGTVEAMIQGEAGAVEILIARARRGPPGAAVAGIRVSEGDGEYGGFETLPTE